MTPVTIAGKILHFLVANQPTTAEMDDDTRYYGFLERGSTWYIMREVQSTGVFSFVLGTNNYTTAWANKIIQVYLSIDAVF